MLLVTRRLESLNLSSCLGDKMEVAVQLLNTAALRCSVWHHKVSNIIIYLSLITNIYIQTTVIAPESFGSTWLWNSLQHFSRRPSFFPQFDQVECVQGQAGQYQWQFHVFARTLLPTFRVIMITLLKVDSYLYFSLLSESWIWSNALAWLISASVDCASPLKTQVRSLVFLKINIVLKKRLN